MATLYQFTCPTCPYTAEISGGEDVGMEILTTTIVCLDCRELFDMPSGWTEPFAGRKPPKIVCPNARKHRVLPWIAGGNCPQCGDQMVKSEFPNICWD